MDDTYFPWLTDKGELIEIEKFTNDAPIISHRHEYIEIVFITKGSCGHRYHDTEITLIPGDVFIIVPHEFHSYSISSDVTMYNCQFYPEALGENWAELKEISVIYDMLMVKPLYQNVLNNQELLHLHPAELSYVESMLTKMIEEQNERQIGFHLVHKGYFMLLLAILGRVWGKQFKSESDEFHGKRRMLAEALKYLENNVIDELNISEVAAKACMSPNYFRKVFKELTGLTPIDYSNKIRIKNAVQRLKGNNCSISEVATMVGINDANYFSRLFRKTTGYSPTQFRKNKNSC